MSASALATSPIVIASEAPLSAKLRDHGIETGCSNTTTAQPIASFELRESIPTLTLLLVGGSNLNSGDGFVLRSGDKIVTACDKSNKLAARDLPPGRYDVYPAASCLNTTLVPVPGREGHSEYVCNERITPKLWLYANDMSMPASGRQEITLDSLAKPRFVELTLAAGRMVPPYDIAGQGCQSDGYALQPDVMLDLTDPRENLIVRVLPTATPVRMRTQSAGRGRSCRQESRRYRFETNPNTETLPTYRHDVDLVSDRETEGKVALWLGSQNQADTTKVTLMISDKSTTFEPLARFDAGYPLDTVERRWLGGLFPQLSLSTISTNDIRHGRFVAAAAVFAATPDDALVYVKRDLPSENSEPALAKGEPLAVVAVNEESKFLTGLTADGLIVRVKGNAYALTPPGPVAFPTAPRPTTADVWVMLPPEHAPKAAAYHDKFQKLETCRSNAYAPFKARLPKVMPGFVIASKSPAYVRIENAGHAAQDKKCGTKEKLEAKLAPELAKLSKLVDAERARLLAVAVATHKH